MNAVTDEGEIPCGFEIMSQSAGGCNWPVTGYRWLGNDGANKFFFFVDTTTTSDNIRITNTGTGPGPADFAGVAARLRARRHSPARRGPWTAVAGAGAARRRNPCKMPA